MDVSVWMALQSHLRGPRPPGRRPGGEARTGGGRPQRGHDVADDRALLRRRRRAGQAVRPAGAGVHRVRRAGGPGARHRRALGAGDDELWDALGRARLDDLVRSLVDGLDTVVGERGYRLSGGERQRLTIARLLLARPRVVLLDEATAHLDSDSEAAVQGALAEALEGRTALVIAHRLSTIRAADLILVVEDGRIVEQGRHDELLAGAGRYAHLYRTKFAGEPMPA